MDPPDRFESILRRILDGLAQSTASVASALKPSIADAGSGVLPT